MFIRVKTAKNHRYLQLVQNRREGRRTVQRVVATLGRVDDLMSSGSLTAMRRSLERFSGPAPEDQPGRDVLALTLPVNRPEAQAHLLVTHLGQERASALLDALANVLGHKPMTATARGEEGK